MPDNSYTRSFWGKSEPGNPGRIHLLEHHLADVGACFEALLAQPTIRQRLAKAGGRDELDATTVARLCLLAALHDIGKVNVGFQTQIWRDTDLPPGSRRLRRAGHTLTLSPVLGDDDRETADWFFDALGWWWDATETWDDREGKTVCGLFVATLSHHGLPLQLEGAQSQNPRLWRPFGELNPQECVARIGRLARQWFPEAFASDAPLLPSAPAFQHHFLGLCNLADWIGSNEQWFEYVDTPQDNYMERARTLAAQAVADVGLDLADQRGSFTGVPDFSALFAIDGAPNAIQQAAQETPLTDQLVIIESETGSGKTEAALWRFARMYAAGSVDGMYFALPTRAAAVQIHRRVQRFIARIFPVVERRPSVILAIPGYEPETDAGDAALPDYSVWWDRHYADGRPWAAEQPKRFLAAQIAVGTVDQAMLGALKVKNAHLRSSSLARNLLVVDEVHASDVYMSVILEKLLDVHLGAGGYALLMSATLGATARHRWLHHGRRDADAPPSHHAAVLVPYPAVSSTSRDSEASIVDAGENNQDKVVNVAARGTMGDFRDTARLALDAARAGAKVLVVRNTVGYAVSTQEALEEQAGPEDAGLLFTVNGIPTLHHGRFATGDRRRLDQVVERRLGRNRPADGGIVIGTQTLEQSLDIDADLLITDLCPVDVLLQRIGRLHRHRRDDRPGGYAAPQCIVLTPGADLSPLLEKVSGQNANGLGPRGGVYRSLQILEATRRLIAEHPQWRIPEMNRSLVEGATHPECLQAITAEMGPEWREHEINTEGGYIADQQTAQWHCIKFDKSFFTDNQEIHFASNDEQIRTRLGDDRVDVVFDPPPASSFDPSQAIERLAISVRWLGEATVSDPVDTQTTSDGGFEFAIGQRRFRYDRLGLRRV